LLVSFPGTVLRTANKLDEMNLQSLSNFALMMALADCPQNSPTRLAIQKELRPRQSLKNSAEKRFALQRRGTGSDAQKGDAAVL
jgi:hypothetical protein